MKKDETSLGLISCKAWRGKLQPVFTGKLGYKLYLKPRLWSWDFTLRQVTPSHPSANTKLVSPSPCIRSSKDKSKVTLEAKETKAQENATSDNVQISAPSLPSSTSYLKSCESKELHGSIHVSFFFFNSGLIYIGVQLIYSIVLILVL